jgi:1,6-anhydro-N-acetylmuramate kinase
MGMGVAAPSLSPKAETASLLAIGLMSGASQDGVDVALLDTDGGAVAQFGSTACRPYTAAERALLRKATAAAANLTERTARPDLVAEAEALINDAHAAAQSSRSGRRSPLSLWMSSAIRLQPVFSRR